MQCKACSSVWVIKDEHIDGTNIWKKVTEKKYTAYNRSKEKDFYKYILDLILYIV